MNKFIQAIKDLDADAVKAIISSDPKWLKWEEKDGKNALHFLCGVPMVEMRPGGKAIKNLDKASDASLKILKFLLASGMDINSVHRIPDKSCGYFPATPVWWAYTRGRNEKLYTYLLKQGADPRNCMYAITWYDDTKAATLFKKYGVFQKKPAFKSAYFEDIDNPGNMDSPLLAAFAWKKWKMAEWLLKNKTIKAVGLDTPSIDYGQSADFKTHRILLAQNIPAFENIANLDLVPVKNSYIVALPMQIKKGSGAPLHIIAYIPN